MENSSAWHLWIQRLAIATALIWAGMLIGVTGLATPVKFEAQSLTLPVALDVGRTTFHALNRVEWGLAALLGVLLLLSRSIGLPLVLLIAAGGILLAQTAWLLPVLDTRVAAIIAGTSPPPSYHHVLYGVTEVAKLLILLGLAVAAIRR